MLINDQNKFNHKRDKHCNLSGQAQNALQQAMDEG
jgi:hypothetical protein